MFKDGEIGNKVTMDFYVPGVEVPLDFWDWAVVLKHGCELQGFKVKISLNDEELDVVTNLKSPSA